jgi:hypothetical protein
VKRKRTDSTEQSGTQMGTQVYTLVSHSPFHSTQKNSQLVIVIGGQMRLISDMQVVLRCCLSPNLDPTTTVPAL